MKVKVSDYIADFLVQKGITDVFTVVGGGAMHLNDSLGHHPELHCTYQHHEQACAMAAECYARIENRPACLCVTSGPGALNALNGVAGAYQDSIPMIVLSGQVKSSLTIKSSGLHLRTYGGQEFPIVGALNDMTKYAVMVENKNKIRYHLEKAWFEATTGRMGPSWLDIPIDIQGSYVETEELKSFFSESKCNCLSSEEIHEKAKVILKKLKSAKRPVFYAGNGIRLSGSINEFLSLVEKLNIPVVTCWDSIDIIENDNRLFCGRGGTMGDRAGNFAVQNSDLLICIGSRLSIYQVGYDVRTWARDAYVVVNDIDGEELKKKTVRIDLPVCCDSKNFISALVKKSASEKGPDSWVDQCNVWKKEYPTVQKKHYEEKGIANVYAFMDALSRKLGDNSLTVVTNGSASVVGSNSYYIGRNSRFLMNCAISSMGYGLPASIGACIGSKNKKTVCIEGDGSIMMNLQELQSIVTNRLPIKVFIINNNGYHQIRQTQNNIFKEHKKIGLGPESGDLGFPDFSKIAYAFDMPYVSVKDNDELEKRISEVLESDSYCLCEVFVSTTQVFEPKSATKKLPDGTLVSPPLEDLAPFIGRDELKKNMFIPLVDEK